MNIAILLYLAPIALMIAATLAFRGPDMRPAKELRLIEGIALAAFASAVLWCLALFSDGPATSGMIGVAGLGLSARLDAVSAVMLLLVSFIGWVVIRFAATYMDGEARQGPFTGWLCAALAAVMLLVIAGNTLQLVIA